jgi:hypothetical protein
MACIHVLLQTLLPLPEPVLQAAQAVLDAVRQRRMAALGLA